ncbi:fucosyltransferase [Micromonas commoda]|uniref:Fucosyltransferase n=1 Tax=Micromonas commoda (strain RCC299 / NOUM17 / CCMP2709) TaxID=296587 RepID=C1EJL5_MICCC|nr:fucosyltransferase [Micromonas commoda]ACO68250.1 fucosyltransferase [Micromonas commoda]|eukprot:XP_002506992.1 fucosyltransferase [Micromonas commoda]
MSSRPTRKWFRIIFSSFFLATIGLVTPLLRTASSAHHASKLRSTSFRRHLSVVFQSGGHYGKNAVHFLLQRTFPEIDIRYTLVERNTRLVPSEYDIVAESCPHFQRHETTPCRYTSGAWVQFSGEPGKHYRDEKWCPHHEIPLVRLDTTLKYYAKVHPETHFIWAPYACDGVPRHKATLKSRNLDNFFDRPFLIAWISSNCVSYRASMWRALKQVADAKGVTGVHALGKCENNMDSVGNREARGSNPSTYSKYKFVLVMENYPEPGYVSEKLVDALAGGAIPIYYGDISAAKLIFNESAFIHIPSIWRSVNASIAEPPSFENFVLAAEYIIDISRSPYLKDYLITDVMAKHERLPDYEHAGFPSIPFPPECLDLSEALIEEAYNTEPIVLALDALRSRIQPLLWPMLKSSLQKHV